jgi:hypothetical protein
MTSYNSFYRYIRTAAKSITGKSVNISETIIDEAIEGRKAGWMVQAI